MKKNKINYFIIGIGVILVLITSIVVINKVNKGNSKDELQIDKTVTYDKYIGRWYEEKKQDTVFIHVKSTDNNKIVFDFASKIMLKNLEAIFLYSSEFSSNLFALILASSGASKESVVI